VTAGTLFGWLSMRYTSTCQIDPTAARLKEVQAEIVACNELNHAPQPLFDVLYRPRPQA